MLRVSAASGTLVLLFATTVQAGTVVSQTKSNPYPGIELVRRVESNPANRIHVAYVSLCNDYVHVAATKAPASLRTPGSWGSSQGVQLATNGDFFSGTQVYGDAVGGGVRWPLAQTGNGQSGSWYYKDYGFIAFGDGWVEFSHTERTKSADAARFNVRYGWQPTSVTTSLPAGTRSLVSGFPELVIEGQRYTCSSATAASCFPDRSDMRARHPRTAMGLSQDRKKFILVTVDGRSSSSVGMYGSELAALMDELGAWQAFNLDGGGSSAMWLASQGYVNTPSDGSARSVANHWGVYAGSGSGQSREPGSCFVPGGCFATPIPGADAEPFKDMPPGSQGHDAAIALLNAGIASGCQTTPQRMFCPQCDLTRAQAVAMLVRAAGIDTANPPSSASFSDVGTGSTFFAAIEAAHAAGITSGCGGGKFCPSDPVTRGEMAAFLTRTLGWSLVNPATPSFPIDVPADHLFYEAIETIKQHCVTNGCGTDEYCPDRELSRAEAAIFIARAFDLEGMNPCSGSGGGAGAGGSGGGAGGGTAGVSATGGVSAGGWSCGGAGGHGNVGSAQSASRVEEDGVGCSCRVAGKSRYSDGWPVLVIALLASWKRRYWRGSEEIRSRRA